MAHTSQNIAGIQILIIDNNQNFANVFAKLLQIKGFSVTVETTFKRGLRYLKHKRCHIVFVDTPLDKYDERQILNLLKENEIFKKLKVVLFSSTDIDSTELDEWKKHGLYMHLKKPVKRNVMIKVLEDVRVEINSITSQASTSPIVESDEPTPEQLEKLSRLEKQIQELENIRQSKSSQKYSSPEKIEDISKGSPTLTSPIVESDEPTPEQLEKLSRLEKQIQELENIRQSKSSQKYSSPEKIEDISKGSPTLTSPIVESDEPTPEQLEKLSRLEKQIQELENIRQSKSSQKYSSPEKIEDISKESPTLTTKPTIDYEILNNIISNLRLKSTLKPDDYLLVPPIEVNSKNKEIIKKEIEKTQLEISALKNKILLFHDVDSQNLQYGQMSLSDKKKHKIKKKRTSTEAKKHKIKKKRTSTEAKKHKIKKKRTSTEAKKHKIKKQSH